MFEKIKFWKIVWHAFRVRLFLMKVAELPVRDAEAMLSDVFGEKSAAKLIEASHVIRAGRDTFQTYVELAKLSIEKR